MRFHKLGVFSLVSLVILTHIMFLIFPVQSLAAYRYISDNLELPTHEIRQPTYVLEMPSEILDVKWSPNGIRLAAVVSESFSIHIWNTETWELVQTISEAGVIKIAWSPDGRFIAGVRGGQQESLLIWDVETGEITSDISYPARADGAYAWISQCDWSPDGTRIATNSTTGGILIWDISTANVIEISNTQYTDTVQISWSPDSNRIATSSGIWDIQTNQQLFSFQQGNWLDWNPTGETLAIVAFWSIGHPHAINVIDTNTGVTTETLSAHTGNITALAWASDGRQLASMSLDQTIVIWDAFDNGLVSKINLPMEHKSVMTWNPNNEEIATGGTNGEIYIWSLNNPKTDTVD